MQDSQILARVDHTLLSPTATFADVAAVCEEAVLYKTASVCIPPSFVKPAKARFGDTLPLCTVIGFPLGYPTRAAKLHEAREAIAEGADELDMVINLGDAKTGDFAKITTEIAAVKDICGSNKVLKVIVECCYLSETEKIALCKCVTEGGADFIKTSTGFGTGGATMADIRLFKAHIGPHVQMKAAGGMRTREDFVNFILEGCKRLGTSSAVKVLGGGVPSASY